MNDFNQQTPDVGAPAPTPADQNQQYAQPQQQPYYQEPQPQQPYYQGQADPQQPYQQPYQQQYQQPYQQTVNVNVQGPQTPPKSKMAAGLLGIFLGSIGVHNFYLGFTGKALAQLLITILSCGILGAVSGIWGLIEGIMILTGSINVDANGVPLKD